MNKYFSVCIIILTTIACNNISKNNSNSNNVNVDYQTQLSPDERYGALFDAVQMAQVFPDGKTFADCSPKKPDATILAAYEEAKSKPGFDLKTFISENFEMPLAAGTKYESDKNQSVSEHISQLWEVLLRKPDAQGKGTLIPLPNPYIVPGGRFREVYYWDSYFTMLGLQADNRYDIIKDMVDNFAHIIDTIGFIPNGNRTYYLGRSQPPFFPMMVALLAEGKGDKALAHYLKPMEKEYNFWMDGADKLTTQSPVKRRAVRLDDGTIMNRYWDDRAAPRPESYREDVNTAKQVKSRGLETEMIYHDLRAGAESGWDYSSRWFSDGSSITSIHTTDIIPVDLNALMFQMEMVIGWAAYQAGDKEKGDNFFKKAEIRRKALNKYCWNSNNSFYHDYDFIRKKTTPVPSLAAMYPLFFKIADADQAKMVSKKIAKDFLKAGGVTTTLVRTGQQWDAPNGWAPLQWITIKGLRNYGENALANDIKIRWCSLVEKVYKRTGKMMEKYNVMDNNLDAGGGEYPVQDGFGWTNGVVQKLLKEDLKK